MSKVVCDKTVNFLQTCPIKSIPLEELTQQCDKEGITNPLIRITIKQAKAAEKKEAQKKFEVLDTVVELPPSAPASPAKKKMLKVRSERVPTLTFD